MMGAERVALSGGVSYETIKLLVMHFMPSLLIIVFIYLAYDITITLVPLSEYLKAFEAEDTSPVPDLCTFKDAIAKKLLEKAPELIRTCEGDLERLYEIVVDKYRRHRSELQTGVIRSKSIMVPEKTEAESPRWGKRMKTLSSIGLTKSLWPADTLMRRDISGDIPRNFRLFWSIFTVIAMLWLLNLQVFLLWVLVKEVKEIMMYDFAETIPLTVVLAHMVAVTIIMYVYCKTLAPLATTQSRMSPRIA